MSDMIDLDKRQAVRKVAQSSIRLKGLCLSSLCLKGIHVEGTDTWVGGGGGPLHSLKWWIPLLADAKMNAQTPSFIHLKPLHFWLEFLFCFFLFFSESPTSAAALSFLWLPVTQAWFLTGISNRHSCLQMEPGRSSHQNACKKCDRSKWFLQRWLALKPWFFYSGGALWRIAGEQPSYPRLVSGLFWTTARTFSFFFSF